jgi:hypothetical protein
MNWWLDWLCYKCQTSKMWSSFRSKCACRNLSLTGVGGDGTLAVIICISIVRTIGACFAEIKVNEPEWVTFRVLGTGLLQCASVLIVRRGLPSPNYLYTSRQRPWYHGMDLSGPLLGPMVHILVPLKIFPPPGVSPGWDPLSWFLGGSKMVNKSIEKGSIIECPRGGPSWNPGGS